MTAPPAAARVAVVIVNYQSYEDLQDCLHSLGAPDPGVRICVVDHASEPEAADRTAAAFPNLQLLRPASNAGTASGTGRPDQRSAIASTSTE